VEPELDHHLAVVGEPALELVDLGVGALPAASLDPLLDAIDEHPPVPGVVEQGHVAVFRQAGLVAPEEVVALLELGRRRTREGLEGARVQLAGQALDDRPLPRRVPPLERDHGGDLRLQQRVLQPPQPLLERGEDALVLLLGKGGVQVNRFQHKGLRGPGRINQKWYDRRPGGD
jgi:hypothetical protein